MHTLFVLVHALCIMYYITYAYYVSVQHVFVRIIHTYTYMSMFHVCMYVQYAYNIVFDYTYAHRKLDIGPRAPFSFIRWYMVYSFVYHIMYTKTLRNPATPLDCWMMHYSIQEYEIRMGYKITMECKRPRSVRRWCVSTLLLEYHSQFMMHTTQLLCISLKIYYTI